MISATYINPVRRSNIGPNGRGISRYSGVMILAVLALLYIAQASQTSTKSVTVQSLRQEEAQLTNDVDQLKLESARAQTLDMISAQASPMGLVPVDSVEYLNK